MPHGSCVCSAVQYSFTGPPTMQSVCHCLTCRKLTTSAFATCILIPDANFTLTTPVPLKEYSPKHESGLSFTYKFCETCGTAIYKFSTDAFQGFTILFAGTLDKGEGADEWGLESVKLGEELWSKHKVSWLPPIEGAAQWQEFPAA